MPIDLETIKSRILFTPAGIAFLDEQRQRALMLMLDNAMSQATHDVYIEDHDMLLELLVEAKGET